MPERPKIVSGQDLVDDFAASLRDRGVPISDLQRATVGVFAMWIREHYRLYPKAVEMARAAIAKARRAGEGSSR